MSNDLSGVLRALFEGLVRALSGNQRRPSARPAEQPQEPQRGGRYHLQNLEIIKKWEGLYLEAYLCPANVWTIGYGHTKTAVPGMRITESEAEDLLRQDMEWVEEAVNRLVAVPLTQNQYDALCSFTFNVGAGALGKSTLLKKLNAGDYAGAANEFPRWNRGGGRVLRGLVNRRADEQALFRG